MIKRTVISIISVCCSLLVFAEVSTLHVSPFTKVKVAGSLNVDCIYCPDSVGTVIINAPDPNQLPWVETHVSGDKLHLKLAQPDDVTTAGNFPSVKVYTNYLVKAENEGDSIVRVLSAAEMPEFEARLMGNGRISVHALHVNKVKASVFTGRGSIVLAGTAQRAVFSVDGAGSIVADALECDEASVRTIGVGTIGVNASRKLKVSGAGGTIYFVGTPQIKKSMAVGVKIEPLDE